MFHSLLFFDWLGIVQQEGKTHGYSIIVVKQMMHIILCIKFARGTQEAVMMFIVHLLAEGWVC